VRRLRAELQSRGKEVWLDVEGIRDAELFPSALRRAIESSDAFVFVISPESVRSAFCEQEVAHASDLNKRIVPLALRRVPDGEIPDEIRFRNWIPAEDEGTVERLLAALETDLEWEHQHTRMTVKAVEWDQSGRDRSFLLRGADLTTAERWLTAGAGRDPGPSTLEQEYLLAARHAAQRRQRGVVGASLAVAAISIGLLIFALISRSQAIDRPRAICSAGGLGCANGADDRRDIRASSRPRRLAHPLSTARRRRPAVRWRLWTQWHWRRLAGPRVQRRRARDCGGSVQRHGGDRERADGSDHPPHRVGRTRHATRV
jgi:hypothetical protein